mgnify:CR=1 FL=1
MENLQRLIAARWVALALMAGLTLLAPGALDIPLPTVPLLAIIGITTLFKLFFSARQRTAFSVFEIFAIVSVLLWTSGCLSWSISERNMTRDGRPSERQL